MKDHNSTTLMNKAMKFFFEAVRVKAYKRDRLTLTEDPVFEDFEEGDPLAKLTLRPNLPTSTRKELLKAMDHIKFLNIEFEIADTKPFECKIYIIFQCFFCPRLFLIILFNMRH